MKLKISRRKIEIYLFVIATLIVTLNFSCVKNKNDSIVKSFSVKSFSAKSFSAKSFNVEHHEETISNPLRNKGKHLSHPYDFDINGTQVTYRWDIGSDQFPLIKANEVPPAWPENAVIKTIGPNGDFDNLNGWLSYLQSGPLEAPQIGTLLGGQHNLREIIFNNIITTGKNYVELSSSLDAQHDGRSHSVSQKNNARIYMEGMIRIQINHFRITWLEIVGSRASKSSGQIYVSGVDNNNEIRIQQNIFNGNGLSSHTGHIAIVVNDKEANVKIFRNTIYGYGSGILCNSGKGYIYNNTVFGCTHEGVSSKAEEYVIENNCCFENGMDFNQTAGEFNYNVSGDLTAIGENSLSGQPVGGFYLNSTTTWSETDLTRKIVDLIDEYPPPEGYLAIIIRIVDENGVGIPDVSINVNSWFDIDGDNDIDRDDLVEIRTKKTGKGNPVVLFPRISK